MLFKMRQIIVFCQFLPTTSGCGVRNNHPTWAKKNPRFALCGSESVSVYLWWIRWSRAQVYASRFICMKKGEIVLINYHRIFITQNYTNAHFFLLPQCTKQIQNKIIIFRIINKYRWLPYPVITSFSFNKSTNNQRRKSIVQTTNHWTWK